MRVHCVDFTSNIPIQDIEDTNGKNRVDTTYK